MIRFRLGGARNPTWLGKKQHKLLPAPSLTGQYQWIMVLTTLTHQSGGSCSTWDSNMALESQEALPCSGITGKENYIALVPQGTSKDNSELVLLFHLWPWPWGLCAMHFPRFRKLFKPRKRLKRTASWTSWRPGKSGEYSFVFLLSESSLPVSIWSPCPEAELHLHFRDQHFHTGRFPCQKLLLCSYSITKE